MSATPATAAVTNIPNLPARWQSITSPGTGVTCAIATNRSIWCWGMADGVRGVAWDPSKGDPVAGTAVAPKQVGSASNWVKIALANGHACAENTLQELWCWGNNAFGQLGSGTFTSSQVPVLVKAFGKKWNDFDVSGTRTCAISESTYWCWGNGLAVPALQSTSATITPSSELQMGDIMAIKSGNRIWIEGKGELLPLIGQSWKSIEVARANDFGIGWSQNYSYCVISSSGAAYCYNENDRSIVTRLGNYTDWVSISTMESTPRQPICGLRGSAQKVVTCFNPYRADTVKIGEYVFNPYGGLSYVGFTNGFIKFDWALNGWDSRSNLGGQAHAMAVYSGTLPENESISLTLPGNLAIRSLDGAWFQGSVPQDTSYFVWGRLFALTTDGQLYVIGDGKYGERQDSFGNSDVTDTWSPSLVQSPTASRTDRSLIPKSGGATVKVLGSFLVGVTGVNVGDKVIDTWQESDSGTTLEFLSPANPAGGTVDVTVTTNAGSVTLNGALTYGDSPSAPVITGLNPGDKAVTVNWSAPSSAGSSAITSYVVTLLPGGATCTWTSGPLSCTVSGLTNGIAYRASVRAFSNVGPGIPSLSSSSFVPFKAPSAPNVMSVAPGDGQITVTWLAPDNGGSAITSYEAVAQPGGNSCATGGTGTSCTISPLTNGTAYSISVYASNDAGGGEVATYNELVTPRTLTSSPTITNINPGDKQLTVNWRAPSSNGGSPVTTYTATAMPGAATCTAVAPATNCTILGLSNGSVYSVTVIATNPAGDSVPSSSVNSSPVTIPGKPTISAVEPGNNSMLVRWRAPSSTGGATVSTYTVTASPGGNSCSTTGAVLFCTITGLDNGTTYAFTVTATNSAGTGSASASYNGVPATSPNSPRNVTATPISQGLTVSWSAPSYDGGTAVTGYQATVRSTGDTCITNASTLSCTFNTLVNGTAYIVDVVSINNAGRSEASSSNNVTPRTVPSRPTTVSLTPGASTIRVTWATPVSDGGSSITAYVATATPGNGVSCTSTGTYCDLLNLTAGTSYSVTVVAINVAGTGAASSPISAVPFERPGAPNSVKAEADDTQINVSWAVPTNNGGSEITGYVAIANGNDALKCVAPSTATSCSIRGLTNGSKYSIRVAAINAAGYGPDAVVPGTVVPRGVSNAPTNITVEAQDKSLIVKWRAVTSIADTNGAAISKYVAKAMPSGATCQVDGFTNNIANTTCTISGLTNGIAQTVTVVAVNDAGSSANSTGVLRTPRSAPGAPVGVSVEILNGALGISWNPPVDSGGVPIIGYTVTAAPDGVTGTVISCAPQSGDSRNCVIGNLSNGTSYTVRVTAQNDVGFGPASEPKTAIPAAVPSKPSKPWPQVGNGQISIRWQAAQDNGSPITSYRVFLEPGGYECEVTDLSFLGCTISSLDNGIAYSISVIATNAAGDSEPAAIPGTATPRAIASPVQSVLVSAATGQATVSWVPGFNGGSPIQSYTVTASPGGTVCQAPGTATQCIVKNLVNGTQYTFSVVAVNEAGSSQPALSTKTLIAGTPNAPVALKVKPGDGMITVTFAPPAINGGTPVTNYTVFVNDESACTVTPSKALSCVVNGLENGSPQIVRVVANNLIGPSASTPEVVATPGKVSGPVSDVVAAAGVGSLTVSWTEPEDDGGSPITGYAVTVTPGGKTCKTDASATSCEISGLTIGTTYVAKVVAINGIGASIGVNSSAVKIVGPPSSVRNLSATAMTKGAKLYFATPSNNGGSPITAYYFTVTGPSGFLWESGPVAAAAVKSSYSITGLTKNVTYTISVVVENDFGMSAAVSTTVKSK
ncbi:MAG: fibronectin type III domain-containing protein [Acidobacteria bacterium]|nr:fibronectin type III domain-containing protein [Acidobacteriota bacterium]